VQVLSINSSRWSLNLSEKHKPTTGTYWNVYSTEAEYYINGRKVELEEYCKYINRPNDHSKYFERSLEQQMFDSPSENYDLTKPNSFGKIEQYDTKQKALSDTFKTLCESDPYKKQVGGDHYKNFPIQPAVYNRKNNLGWYESNVVKYVSRHRFKNKRQDIEKAIHMLECILKEYDDGELM
jgi:Protein of unknwon function (DUF3310)